MKTSLTKSYKICQIINLLESNDINYVFKYNDLQKETIFKKNEILYLDSLSYNLIDGLLQKEKLFNMKKKL